MDSPTLLEDFSKRGAKIQTFYYLLQAVLDYQDLILGEHSKLASLAEAYGWKSENYEKGVALRAKITEWYGKHKELGGHELKQLEALNLTIKLTDEQVKVIQALPESGLGYHWVDVIMTDGRTFGGRTVLNSSELVIEEGEKIDAAEIKNITAEK